MSALRGTHRTRAGRVTRALLAAALAVAVAGCAAHVLPAVHSEGDRLRMADQAYARRDLLDAIDLYKTYIQRNAGTAQVDGAICMLGQCYLDTRDWPSAEEQFERLLKDYPESDSAGSAAYLLGEALMGQSRPRDFDQQYTQKALDQWDDYMRRYPDHWRHAQAERRVLEVRSQLAAKLVDTGDLYVKLHQYQPARMYYQRVIDQYRETVPSADAELGLALVDARLGKIAEAIDELKDLEQRFPGRPVTLRAQLERTRLEQLMARAAR